MNDVTSLVFGLGKKVVRYVNSIKLQDQMYRVTKGSRSPKKPVSV